MAEPIDELGIAARLRLFREYKRISRTAFAISLGIGGERLASYESGRVPLRYEVYRILNDKYFLNPVWLARGESPPNGDRPYNLGPDSEKFSGKFSKVYADHLESICRDERVRAEGMLASAELGIQKLLEFLDANPKVKVDPVKADT